MSLKEEFDADNDDWIDVAKAHWERTPGINNVKVNILQSYEMSDSDGENVILIDKRRSAKKMKKIGNVFLLLGIILISSLFASTIRTFILDNDVKIMDYLFIVLLTILFILLSLFFLNLSGAPHFRLTRNKDELHIEKWLSHKSDSISYSTKRASLQLYKVDYEVSRTRALFSDHGSSYVMAMQREKSLALIYWLDEKQEIFGLDPDTTIHYNKVDDFIEGFVGLA